MHESSRLSRESRNGGRTMASVRWSLYCGFVVGAIVLAGCNGPASEDILDGRSSWSEAEKVRPSLEFFETYYRITMEQGSSRSELVSRRNRVQASLPQKPDVCGYMLGMGAQSLEEAVALQGVALHYDAADKLWKASFSEAEIKTLMDYSWKWSNLRGGKSYVWVHGQGKPEIVVVPTDQETAGGAETHAARVQAFREGDTAQAYALLEPRLVQAVLKSLDACLGASDETLGRKLRMEVLEKQFSSSLVRVKEVR